MTPSISFNRMAKVALTAPIYWGVMTQKQMLYVAKLQVAGMEEDRIWLNCFLKFTGLKPVGSNKSEHYFSKKGVKGIITLQIDEVLSFKNSFKFTTRSYVGIKPLAKIGKFIPCDELLRDVQFLQYLDIENFYQAYIFTQKEYFLNLLLATLYKIKSEKYKGELPEKRAGYFQKRSKEEKLLTIMWIMGVKEYFTKKFRYLFAPESQDEELPSSPPDMYAIVQNQVRALTDGDITKREKVLEANVWDALDELNEKIRESKQLVAENK